MSTSSARAAHTLIALLSPDCGGLSPQVLAATDAEEWHLILKMALAHRLLPVLGWRLQGLPKVNPPAAFTAQMERTYRYAAITAMTRQRDLVLVFRVFNAAAIEAVAQKGAYLAFNAYPHPALRPMRDLDVLVREHQALAAFETLLAAGFKRDPAHPGDPRAHMAANKHLPRLIGPGGSVVEVHHRLVEWRNPLAESAGQRAAVSTDLAEAPGYWERVIVRRVAGTPIRFPDPTDLLLHQCIHAGYDDRFGGGALTLFDLDFLIRRCQPDWPRFWEGAARGGWQRGCALLLRLQTEVFATPGIVWPEPDPSVTLDREFIRGLVPLLLGDTRQGREGRLSKESEDGHSMFASLGLAVQRLIAPPSKVATLFTVPADSWRVWLYYPAYWWRLIGRRLPEYLRARSNRVIVSDERSRAQVEAWLKGVVD